MKLGIITDSSAGLTAAQAKQRGWIFLPLYMNIDKKDYADGIDMEAKDFYAQASIEQEVRTSATPPALIMDAFEKASKEFDHVIVYGLSAGLSSQTNNLTTFAKEFNNIHVIDSRGVGYAITKDLETAEKMAKQGSSIEEIVKEVTKLSHAQFGVAIPASLKWLVKGGRVSPAVAGMANLLKIVPLISFAEGKLDKYGKGRVFDKAVINVAEELVENYPNREYIIYIGAIDGEEALIKELKEILGRTTEIEFFPPVIATHTGPEVIAIMTREKSER